MSTGKLTQTFLVFFVLATQPFFLWYRRMRGNAQKEKDDNVREIEKNLDILVAPAARNTPQIQKATSAIQRLKKAQESENGDGGDDE